jgi:low temperature requirement protein LtrA
VEHGEIDEQRVTPLELFFDLVFVFAITQVTGFLSADPTWAGLGHGLLLIGALWWAWAAYAWLTNTLDAEEGRVRLTMLAAMSAMLLAALAVPHAFGDDAVLFGAAYFLVRLLHIALYAFGARADRDVLAAVLRMAPTALLAPAIILLAGFTDGPVQVALWVGALALDYSGVLVGGGRGWTVSPHHFAERHALIVIIALGESIVALGVGATAEAITAGVIVAAVLGIVVISALWWAYFDVVAIVAERRLAEATGAARAALARDSYSYLHMPMIAGIILFALGLKKTLNGWDEPLEIVPAVGLCGGLALYFAAHVAFRLRNVHSLSRRRLVVAAGLLGLIPLATEVDALVALALVSAVCAGLIAYEAIRFREARARVRAAHSATA